MKYKFTDRQAEYIRAHFSWNPFGDYDEASDEMGDILDEIVARLSAHGSNETYDAYTYDGEMCESIIDVLTAR